MAQRVCARVSGRPAINTASGGHRWQASRLLWLNVELNNWRLPCRLVELRPPRLLCHAAYVSVILCLLRHFHLFFLLEKTAGIRFRDRQPRVLCVLQIMEILTVLN